MSQLTYNGITLPFQRMVDATEEVVRSDDGMDYLFTSRSYTVDGCLDPTIPGLLQPGETFVHAIKRIEHKLLEARRGLQLVFGNGVVLDLPAGSDVKYGPFPEVLQFTRFDGQTHALIRFRIKCHTIDCEGVRVPQWLSNRWTESVRISGEDFRTVKTRRGKLVVRPGPLFVDAFRGLVTPSIPPMFLRNVANYEVQSDGLALSYHFEDEEQYALPPAGSIKASGTCRISSDKGVFMYAEVSVRLTGDVQQDKQRLVQLAAAAVMDRIERIGPIRGGAKGRIRVVSGAVVEQMWKNEVEVTIRTLLQPPRQTSQLDGKVVLDKFFGGIERNGGGDVLQFGANAVGLATRFQQAVVGGVEDLLKWAGRQPKGGVDNPRAGAGPAAPLPKAQGKPGNNAGSPPLGGADSIRLPKGLGVDSFGPRPFGGDQPNMGLRSTAGLGLVAAALNDPCLTLTIRDFNGQPPLPTTDIGQAQAPAGPIGVPPGTAGGARGEGFKAVGPAGTPTADAGNSTIETGVGFGTAFVGIGLGPVQVIGRDNKGPRAVIRVIENVQLEGQDDGAEYLTGGIYTDYRIVSRFENKGNYAELTEQKKGGLTHFIPTSGAGSRMIVEWTATRAGEPPVIPDAGLNDDNVVFLGSTTLPPSLDELAEDGVTMLFTQSGVFTYGFKDPAKIKFGATVPPWMADLMGLAPRATIYDGPDVTTISGQVLANGGGGALPEDLSKWEVNIATWQDKQPKG